MINQIITCDRCRGSQHITEASGLNAGYTTVHTYDIGGRLNRDMHFCPKCEKSFREWLLLTDLA